MTAPTGVAISRAEIERVHRIIAPAIRRTPVLRVSGADLGLELESLTLKLETTQRAGSFKTRGAFTHLLTREVPAAGVAAASGGNHGAAVAFAAGRLGVPARIFVPRTSSAIKLERIRSSGASVDVHGEGYADALARSEAWVGESGAMVVHAFDQPETILGQGTLALELDEQVPDLDTVLVGVGGGGLISGIATWFEGRARIVGVEPELAPTLTRALAAGEPVDAPTESLARSLAPKRVGTLVYPIVARRVERTVLVSDDEILRAQRVLGRDPIWPEPEAAAAFAALASGRYCPAPDERVAVVVSGGNAIMEAELAG
ncbi:MAG: serine/threonine dehydratase [Gemmatimonadales bacterium]